MMIIKKLPVWALVGVWFAVILTGCPKVAINPADSSPPSVVIKVQGANGEYQAQTSVKYQGSPINVMAIVEDPQGVKAIKLEYVNTVASSCAVGSAFHYGSYHLALPSPVEQTLSGSSGQAITKLPLLTTITGPFKCTVPGVGLGNALGHTFKLRATGANWSSNPQVAKASKDLDISIF